MFTQAKSMLTFASKACLVWDWGEGGAGRNK